MTRPPPGSLGVPGAELLLGQGDMLMVVGGAPPIRFRLAGRGGLGAHRAGGRVELGPRCRAGGASGMRQSDWDTMTQWAIDNGADGDVASGAAIRRRFGCGSSQASKARDLARELAGEGSTRCTPP